MERTYSHIDLDERRKIACWPTARLSVEVIAEKLGRHRSTIFREIKRNTFADKDVPDFNGYYCVTTRTIWLANGGPLELNPVENIWQFMKDNWL